MLESALSFGSGRKLDVPCAGSHHLCRIKNPRVIQMWLLVVFHPATLSVQSTPADNTRKRVWQYMEKERKTGPGKRFQGLATGDVNVTYFRDMNF